MADPRQFKRKQYLVDPGYQLRFATQLFATVLGVALLSALIATGILWTSLSQSDLEHQATFVASLVAVSTTLLVELLIAIPIIFYLGIRQSHRIVGPMNRIQRLLEAMAAGDYSQRLTLRPGDVLTDLAEAINRLADSLKDRGAKPPQ